MEIRPSEITDPPAKSTILRKPKTVAKAVVKNAPFLWIPVDLGGSRWN